jgi:hypothetical protein
MRRFTPGPRRPRTLGPKLALFGHSLGSFMAQD